MRLTLGDLRNIIREEVSRLVENSDDEIPKVNPKLGGKVGEFVNWKVRKKPLSSDEKEALAAGEVPDGWPPSYFAGWEQSDFNDLLARFTPKKPIERQREPGEGGLRVAAESRSRFRN